jgi:site-specific recombinase XerD
MVREMSLREFSASTQRLYLATLTDLARYYHESPDALDGTQVQDYLLYLTRERHLASSSVSVAASAIRFFYMQTVNRRTPPLRRRIPSNAHPAPRPAPSGAALR